MPMRGRALLVTLIVVLSATVPACASDATLLGTGLGAAFGGLVGNQFGHGSSQVAATGLGIVAGGLVGNSIGQSIDNENAQSYSGGGGYAVRQAPSPIVYQPYAPNYVAPSDPPPIYVSEQEGTYCRPFSQAVRINGRIREAYGTACLQPDGSWRIVQ